MKQYKHIMACILAGGTSSRMGEDKAWINYHGEAELLRLSSMLKGIGLPLVVSANKLPAQGAHLPLQTDLAAFSGHGPLSGLLSVHHIHPEKDILLIACDYPGFGEAELQGLLDHAHQHTTIAAFENDEGIVEPLLAFYPSSALASIKKEFLKSGHDSLRRYLEQMEYKALKAVEGAKLKSIDRPEQRRRWVVEYLKLKNS